MTAGQYLFLLYAMIEVLSGLTLGVIFPDLRPHFAKVMAALSIAAGLAGFLMLTISTLEQKYRSKSK